MDQLEFQFSAGSSAESRVVSFLDEQGELIHPVSAEYPMVFSPRGGGRSLWVEVQGKVVSHVAFVVRQFRHPLFNFKVGLIGSVATDSEFRGYGLATSLLRQAVEELRGQGCALAVLWSNNPVFYRTAGFYPAGFELEMSYESAWDGPVSARVKEGVADTEIARLWKLYTSDGVGLERDLEHFERFLKIPGLRCFARGDDSGISAYAVLNKGTDFADVIHEWAGNPEHVVEIIGHLKQSDYRHKGLRVLTSAFRDVSLLERRCQRASVDAMGLMKVLDRSTLRAIFISQLRNEGIPVDWRQELVVDGQKVAVATDEEFLGAVFGWGLEERPAFASKLPFFIWGADSV